MTELWGKLKPLSRGQAEMKKALESREYDIVGLFGPTGTGKSLFSLVYGLDMLQEGIYSRFIISRPLIDIVTGREITATDIGSESYIELVSAYMRDILSKFVEWDTIRKFMDEGKIVFADTRYLRGRTFDDSIIFLDDAQNLSPESAVEIVLRIGSNSKLIVAGDPIFQKVPSLTTEGASVIRELLLGEETAKVVDLGLKDIVRPGARRGIRLLLETKMRKRELNDKEKEILDAARIYSPDADIITVVTLSDDKEKFEIKSEHTPDAIIVVKKGSMGRLIGRGGERIQKIEETTGIRLRGLELTLDFKELVRAIHPVSWIHKHVVDIDFVGPYLNISVTSEGFGAFVGQKGFYVKFLDSVVKKMLGIGVRVSEVPVQKEKRGRR